MLTETILIGQGIIPYIVVILGIGLGQRSSIALLIAFYIVGRNKSSAINILIVVVDTCLESQLLWHDIQLSIKIGHILTQIIL